MYTYFLLLASLILLTACGKTVAYKDGVVAVQAIHDADYNACVQEAVPLYPTQFRQRPYWVQTPIYGYAKQNGKLVSYFSHYQHQLHYETIDANEAERHAYIERCMSAKGYIYRYLSPQELTEEGLD